MRLRLGLDGAQHGEWARTQAVLYVCTGFHNKGRTICPNGVPLPMREADDAILTQLREYVLRPDIVEGALVDAIELLRPQADTIEARRAELQVKLRTVEEEAARLAAAVAAGGEFASLRAALRERDDGAKTLQRQLTSLDGLRDVSSLDVRHIERDLRARVKDWRALLGRQVPIARQIVTKLLDGRLVFTPRKDRAYEFTGRVSIGRLLQGIVLPSGWRPLPECRPKVVSDLLRQDVWIGQVGRVLQALVTTASSDQVRLQAANSLVDRSVGRATERIHVAAAITVKRPW